MLQIRQHLTKFHPIGKYLVSIGMLSVLVAKPASPEVNIHLEFQGYRNLVCLDNRIRLDEGKKLCRSFVGNHPTVDGPVVWVRSLRSIDVASKLASDGFNDGFVCHVDPYIENHALLDGGFVLWFPTRDPQITLSIEESRDVFKAQHVISPTVIDRMLAKSGDTRCPAHKGAEGQSRTKQAALQLGVRNEHGPTPKGKMCSELGRNVERSAEMTDPVVAYMYASIRPQVTDCNVNHVHFYVDPQMFFSWSEPRTWPNQFVTIRLVALRLALVWKSRMFHTVIDGWTA